MTDSSKNFFQKIQLCLYKFYSKNRKNYIVATQINFNFEYPLKCSTDSLKHILIIYIFL